ncbi:MAG: GvpL/GvpF family gas vesicle protein [Gemmatimonadaceae bacterium]|nr:GvpL/GvpF family gas vesicle protein [Gemmatimonadaceae bacterium]
MTVYLYCLVASGHEPAPGLTGLGGAPVRVVSADGVDAWVSDLHDAGRATVAHARAHDAVVRAAMAQETPLPARFGQTFADDGALCRSLRERGSVLAERLARVRGAAEMTVRLLVEPSSAEALASEQRSLSAAHPSTGRAYLALARARQEARAEAARRADFLQARLWQCVAGVVREEARTPLVWPARSVTLSHLVARDALATYRLAVQRFVERELRQPVLLSGPWAPYSFTEQPRG